MHWTASTELTKIIVQKKNVGQVIVIFIKFRHTTMFCEARKNLSINRVHFDLTKDRSTLYQKSRDLKKLKKYIIYVHIDVNCRLKVKFEKVGNNFFHL